MALRDLIPWRKSEMAPAKHEYSLGELHREMNRLFDEFFRASSFEWPALNEWPAGDLAPRLDVSEDDKAVRISAELPGVDEKDIQITLTDKALTLTGEKKEAHEDKGKHFYRSERSYGMFRRVIPLPAEVDEEKVEAKFKHGVLKITLPKVEGAEGRRKRIEVKTS